jgi:hypothetical protein
MHEPASSFAAHIAAVAQELLGAPNLRLSSDVDIYYGTNGSLHIDVEGGRFYDHESKTGGGVLDLIARQTGRDHKSAVAWMKEHGYLEAREGNGSGRLGKEVAHYDYVDEHDELIFQVVRFEPKTFRQRRKDQTGAWSWSVRGVRIVPYRLPDLLEAVSLDRTVYIVEGEKDVESLKAIGLTATCNPGGAGKWRAELCQYLQGADVVILPDHDQSGQDHARAVAQHFSGIAARIRVLDLSRHWDLMPEKGDVSDWIKCGGTSEALQGLVDKTRDWSPAPFASKFGGQRWEEIATLGHASGYTWLVEDIFPMGEISLIFGDSGSGKSFGTFDMAMSIARGLIWNGKNVEPGLVVYVAAEAGKGFGKRKLAYAIEHSLSKDLVLPFYLCTKRPDFFCDDADLVALIEEIIAVGKTYQERLVLIVIDTLSALAPGMNENASQDVSMVRKRLVALQDKFGVAVVLVHHKPKGGGSPRGHSSLTADFETTIEFEIVADRRTSTGGNIHRATVRKQREGKSGIKWEFTLPVVCVGRNKWGNEETSCVVIPYETGQSNLRGGYNASANERLLMHALYDALAEYGVPPPFPLPASITKVVDVACVRSAMRAKVVDDDADEVAADNRFRGSFKRAGDKLRDAGIIGIQKPFWWATGKAVNGMGG